MQNFTAKMGTRNQSATIIVASHVLAKDVSHCAKREIRREQKGLRRLLNPVSEVCPKIILLKVKGPLKAKQKLFLRVEIRPDGRIVRGLFMIHARE